MEARTTRIITAVIVIALLSIGAGYALTYEGKTTNTGNTSAATYITIGGDKASQSFSSGVVYDTVNTGTSADPNITYTFNESQLIDVTGITGKVIKLGEVALEIVQTGSTGNDYTITMTSSAGTIMGGTYYVVFGTDGPKNVTVTDNAFSVVSDSISGSTTSVTAALYLAAEGFAYSDAMPIQPLDGVTFDFVAKITTT